MFRENLRAAKQAPFFKQSIEQFGRELSTFFPDRDIISQQIKKSDDVDEVYKQRPSKDSILPFFTFRLDSMSPNKEKHNRYSLFKNGLVIDKYITTIPGDRPDDPNKVYSTLHLTPTDVTFDVVFYCSYEDAYDFGPMWQQAAQNNYLNFNMEVGTKSIAINVALSEDISFGEMDDELGQYMQVVTSAVMSTYHGVISSVKPINSYKVTTGIVSEKSPDAKLVPLTEIRKRKDTTVFAKTVSKGDN